MRIINADDFGLSLEVNEAIDQCFLQKLINQTTLVVNMPFTKDAVERSIKHGYAENVGLHLNLVEGNPLTEAIKHTKLCDKEGCFNENLIRDRFNRLFLDSRTRKAVRDEIEAQIKRYLDYGFTLRHIDSHEHTHTNLSIIPLLVPILKKYGFKSIRLTRNIPPQEICGLKSIYKHILNMYLIRKNKASIQYSKIRFFGSLTDTESSKKDIQIYQELMVHPVLHSNMIIDAICKYNIVEWEQQNISK